MKYLQQVKRVGVDHYNSTIFQEYDMGTHALQMGHYKAYDKDNTLIDEGTYVSTMHTHTHTRLKAITIPGRLIGLYTHETGPILIPAVIR